MTGRETQELVRAAKAGDESAFTEIVNLYSSRVYNLALKIVRNTDEAADILQETFLKVYEKIDTFDGRSDLFSWIYRIATNFSLMRLRKSKRVVLSDEDLEEKFDRPDSSEIQTMRALPLQSMISDEFQEHLRLAIDSLPEIYRSVFILRDLEQLSIKETSSILDITESNVKIRLQRARMFLRETLSEYMSDLQRRE